MVKLRLSKNKYLNKKATRCFISIQMQSDEIEHE